jgi:hypothetical protein
MEVAGNVSRTATEVTDGPFSANQSGKMIEEVSVEEFVVQFVIKPPDVFIGNQIVAALELEFQNHNGRKFTPMWGRHLSLMASWQRSVDHDYGLAVGENAIKFGNLFPRGHMREHPGSGWISEIGTRLPERKG